MGGASKSAKRGNEIAEASLKEQKRQYNAQRRREKAKEASAKANAFGTRTSANMSYANTFNQSTDYGVGLDGSYSFTNVINYAKKYFNCSSINRIDLYVEK